jgi:hypothetical protein
MGGAGRGWKLRKVKINLVGGDHDGVVGEGDVESGRGWAFIGVGGRNGKEMASGAGV